MKETVDAFKCTTPLIMDLRNPAMRDRHWNSIMNVIGTVFDPLADTFTLDSMVQLRLDKHAESIAELSTNASKELAIEVSIQVGRILFAPPEIMGSCLKSDRLARGADH